MAIKLPEMGSAGKLSELLRNATIPVITGAYEGKILFHMRTLQIGDENNIIKAFDSFLNTNQPSEE